MSDAAWHRPYTAALIGCGKIGTDFADDPLMRGDVFSHAEAYGVCLDTEEKWGALLERFRTSPRAGLDEVDRWAAPLCFRWVTLKARAPGMPQKMEGSWRETLGPERSSLRTHRSSGG